jgi:hypothetical protein
MKDFLKKLLSDDHSVSLTRILVSIVILSAIVYLFISLKMGKTQDTASILTAMLGSAFGGKGIQSIAEYFGSKQ